MTANKTLNTAISVVNAAVGKNRIINGNFDIWQRGTSLTSTATVNEYSADRWRSEGYATNTVVSRQAFTGGQTEVPNNPNYYCRVALTATNSSGYWAFQQRIESPQMMRAYGTYTLSFWIRATSGSVNTGTWNYGINGVTGTGPALTTAWQKITHTVTISSAASESAGYVTIYLIYLPTNTPAVSFDVAQVQLEVGSVASPFEVRPYGMELALCQRYFFLYAPANTDFQEIISRTATTSADFNINVPVSMRTTPVISLSGTSPYGRIVCYDASFSVVTSNVTAVNVIGGATQSSTSIIHIQITHGSVAGTNSAGGASFDTYGFAGYIGVSAEL